MTEAIAAHPRPPVTVGGVMPRPLTLFEGEPPSFDGPEAKPWFDGKGRVVARSRTVGAHHWLAVAGIGAYRFPRVAPADMLPVVEGKPEPDVPLAELEDVYLRSVLPVALQAYGLEVLHASAVEIAGTGVVALCGRSTSGKSTLAYALAERGHRHVADDAVVVDPPSRRVLPLPTAARLRAPSAQHFRAADKSSVFVSLEGWDERSAAPLPLAAAVLLRRGPPELTLRTVDARAAFEELLAEAYVFDLGDPERKRAMMRAYLGIAAALPVYELAYPDGLEHLPAVCDAIASAVGGGTPG